MLIAVAEDALYLAVILIVGCFYFKVLLAVGYLCYSASSVEVVDDISVICFCTSEGICGVASAMDGGGSTQQRCFCDSKNSPSTNIHGCIFVDEVSAPYMCKSPLFRSYFFWILLSLCLWRTGVPPPRFPLVSFCRCCSTPAVFFRFRSKNRRCFLKQQKGYRFYRCP